MKLISKNIAAKTFIGFATICFAANLYAQNYEPFSVPNFLEARGYQDGNPTFENISREIAPGVTHDFVYQKEKPLAINFVTIDLDQPNLSLEAEKGQVKLAAKETVLAVTSRLDMNDDSRTLMAINADFWGANSIVINLMVDNGVIWRSPYRSKKGFNRPVFSRDTEGKINIGNPEFNVTLTKTETDDTVTFDAINTPFPGMRAFTWVYDFELPKVQNDIQMFGKENGIIFLDKAEFIPNKPVTGIFKKIDRTEGVRLEEGQVMLTHDETFPEWLTDGSKVELHAKLGSHEKPVYMAVGGGPTLLQDGEILTQEVADSQGISESFVTTKHPRTAVGVKENGDVVFVTVDGRQAGRSVGIDLFDLAKLMKDKGCVQAMNLDGGGSTSLALRGEVTNFPSNIYGLRPVGNFVVLRTDSEIGEASKLQIRPKFARVLPSSILTFNILPLDKNNETTTLPEDYQITANFPEGFNQNWIGVDGNKVMLDVDLPKTPGEFEFDIMLKVEDEIVAKESVSIEVAELENVEVDEKALTLEQGQDKPLNIRMIDENGMNISYRPIDYRITVPKFITFMTGNAHIKADDLGAGDILIQVGDKDFRFPVSSGNQQRVLISSLDKEPDPETNNVTGLRYNEGKSRVSLDPFNIKEGTGSWKFHYGMTKAGSSTAKVALNFDEPYPENAYGIGFWLYGDGDGHWMRSEWRDEHGQRHVLSITGSEPGIDWEGEWKWMEAEFENLSPIGEHKEKPNGPFTLETLYLVQTDHEKKTDGEIVIDELSALTIQQ